MKIHDDRNELGLSRYDMRLWTLTLALVALLLIAGIVDTWVRWG